MICLGHRLQHHMRLRVNFYNQELTIRDVIISLFTVGLGLYLCISLLSYTENGIDLLWRQDIVPEVELAYGAHKRLSGAESLSFFVLLLPKN